MDRSRVKGLLLAVVLVVVSACTGSRNIDITKAEAEAKALQIKGQSIASNPRIVELEWINKWNGELPTYMLGSGTNVMLGMSK